MNDIKTFLIQTIDNMVVHDFTFTLIEAIRYHNWVNNEDVYNYITQIDGYEGDIKDIIPIGSVEFVLEYLKNYYSIDDVKPLNIPEELLIPKYVKRKIHKTKTNSNTVNLGSPIFVKDSTKIKGWTDIVEYNRSYPPGEYFISELIDIDSEWRAFIFNRTLCGIQNYSGDFTVFPDIDLIREMIGNCDNNGSYTLDVGINQVDGTFIIECHDFFSCGLYGFSDYKMLPLMFINTWNKLVRR